MAKGGAGAASVANQGIPKARIRCAEPESPKTPIEDDLSDSEINSKDTKEIVPVCHSARTTRKSYKFAELSSDDDSGESSPDLSEHEKEMKKGQCSVVIDIDNEDAAQGDELPDENKEPASGTKSNVSQHSVIRCIDDKARSCRRCGVV